MASSKWSLNSFYSKDARFRPYLPDTALFNRTSLERFMDHYPVVYIKPDLRHGGTGIMQARKTETGYSFVKVKGKPIHADSLDQLYNKIMSHAVDSKHIIQRGIPLATVNGRTYDIRSMMMRMPGGAWKFYGFFAKVAGASSVITNVCRSGGYVLPLEKAMRLSLGLTEAQIEQKKKTLRTLSYQICNRFNGYKATTTEIGIDFAFDRHGNIWIIEVNFDLPWQSGHAFEKLPDKTIFRRVMHMKKLLRSIRRRRKSIVSQ